MTPRPGTCSGQEVAPLHTQDVDSMLVHCWTTVYDVGPTANQHWVNVSCLLGKPIGDHTFATVFNLVRPDHPDVIARLHAM